MTNKKKRMKKTIPNYVILIYREGELKHWIDTQEDLEAVIHIAECQDYKVKYPKKDEWREI